MFSAEVKKPRTNDFKIVKVRTFHELSDVIQWVKDNYNLYTGVTLGENLAVNGEYVIDIFEESF